MAVAMTRSRRAVAAVVAVLACAVAGVACGVPADRRPAVQDRRDVPFDLLAPTAGPPSTTTTVRETVPLEVFFVRETQVVASVRRVPRPVTLRVGLDQLLGGPTEVELDQGLRSALSSPTEVQLSDVTRGVARIELSAAFASAPPEEQLLGLAQLVFTVTGFPGIGGVQFLVGGAAIEVPRPDGSLSGEPVTRDDFRPLLSG